MEVTSPEPTTRERIVSAAAGLLTREGRDGVSTRAVSAEAGVQPPTLYRLFGDKNGLLDAVAAHGFEEYLAGKRALGQTDDPVRDLRRGWDLHVEFGLAKPAFYVLMYGEPGHGRRTQAGRQAASILHGMISRVASAGRLRMGVERAAGLVHATGVGVVLSLLATPPDERDPELSHVARDSVLRAIITDGSSARDERAVTAASRATALREAMLNDGRGPLSPVENALLTEWLDRIANAPTSRRSETEGLR